MSTEELNVEEQLKQLTERIQQLQADNDWLRASSARGLSGYKACRRGSITG